MWGLAKGRSSREKGKGKEKEARKQERTKGYLRDGGRPWTDGMDGRRMGNGPMGDVCLRSRDVRLESGIQFIQSL